MEVRTGRKNRNRNYRSNSALLAVLPASLVVFPPVSAFQHPASEGSMRLLGAWIEQVLDSPLGAYATLGCLAGCAFCFTRGRRLRSKKLFWAAAACFAVAATVFIVRSEVTVY